MKKLLVILSFICISVCASAQTDEMFVLDVDAISDIQLDTINVKKKLVLNDYTMLGVQYGVGLSRVMWNPTQKQDMVFVPMNVGVTVTTYAKMFGYMPYFGFQAGIFYGQEGYQFKYNKDKNYTYTIAISDEKCTSATRGVSMPCALSFSFICLSDST